MSEPDAIAVGLAERLATIPGFEHRASDVEPDQINPPCTFVLGPNSIEDLAFGCDAGIFEYDCWVIVKVENGVAQAQRDVRKYLAKTGESSIQKALEADTTLGGRAQTLIVQGGVSIISEKPLNDVLYMGASRTVRVYSLGS